VIADDPVDHREAHPRPLASLLGREEGLEDPGAHLARHAAPVSATVMTA
jgi:hypothetical protein